MLSLSLLAWLLPLALSTLTLSLTTVCPLPVKETPGMLTQPPIPMLAQNLDLELQLSDKSKTQTNFSLISLLTTCSLLTRRSLFLWSTILLMLLLDSNTTTHSPTVLSSVSLTAQFTTQDQFLTSANLTLLLLENTSMEHSRLVAHSDLTTPAMVSLVKQFLLTSERDYSIVLF